MPKIAIDIALLLPDQINKYIFELNQKSDQTKIKLGKNAGEAMPHISLAMGGLDFFNLSNMKKELEAVYQKYLPMSLKSNGGEASHVEGEGLIWGINIEKTPPLQSLHQESMDILKKYSISDFDSSAFADKNSGIERAMKWAKGYEKKHSAYNNFSPHITVGFGKEEEVKNLEFKVSTLAICQLGSYCTCKKILKSYSTSL